MLKLGFQMSNTVFWFNIEYWCKLRLIDQVRICWSELCWRSNKWTTFLWRRIKSFRIPSGIKRGKLLNCRLPTETRVPFSAFSLCIVSYCYCEFLCDRIFFREVAGYCCVECATIWRCSTARESILFHFIFLCYLLRSSKTVEFWFPYILMLSYYD